MQANTPSTMHPANTLQFHTRYKTFLADTLTPVQLYLKLRDNYPKTVLLESSDYHSNQNSHSYICFEPLAHFKVENDTIEHEVYGHYAHSETIHAENNQVVAQLQAFSAQFTHDKLNLKVINNGLFGYISYNAVQYFESVAINQAKSEARDIPDILYHIYKYVICFDHLKDTLYFFENVLDTQAESQLETLTGLLFNRNFAHYPFKTTAATTSNFTDAEYLKVVEKGISHCNRGDVFQIVLSRRFNRPFMGDEFNVYRALRSINPSPYLFYFDFGNFKLFGSSPEAQIVIENGTASIHPIAGTFKRTGNDEADRQLAAKLLDDPKEIAEHVMLVDLARNDLSKNGYDVQVENFKEVQFYSHVIHLVSKVTAKLHQNDQNLQLVADTFPAGTLSGAPKYKAMELIDTYEHGDRGFYGGALGFLGFDGTFNHCITIRTFLSKNNQLYFQAGAGVVSASVPENELQEVNNKLAALNQALEMAEKISE